MHIGNDKVTFAHSASAFIAADLDTDTVNDNMRAKENCLMSIPKNRRDNANKIRKQTPHPHGKIKSFRELAEE